MEQKTQTDQTQGLQDALMQAALGGQISGEQESTAPVKNGSDSGKSEAKQRVSPLNGVPVPNGRTKGTPNKTTKTIRDAVMQAFDDVGGAEYLVRLANGTQSDRAAFTSLLNKVLPTQINANVEGGIKLELSWLGSRSIGTTQAQIPEQHTQVIDLEQESNGRYRIKDPTDTPAGGGDAGGKGQEGVKDA